jgi:hypothetical protein
MANTTRAILIKAHTLIQEEKYTEARALLMPVADHPTAAKWLDQIDEMIPSGALPRRKPKLDKAASTPDWATRLQSEPSTSTSEARKAKPQTASSLDKPPVSSNKQLISLIGGTAAICVVIFGVLMLLSGQSFEIQLPRFIHETQTYSNSYMTLQHSTSWGDMDTSQFEWCSGGDIKCLHYVRNGSGVELFIQYLPLPRYIAPDEFAAFSWNSNLDNPSYELTNPALSDTLVGSVPGLIQMYEVEARRGFQAGFVIDIFVPDGYNGYVFSFSTGANICAVDHRLIPEISEIMSSVRFRSQTTLPAEDGYTPATPVTFTIPKCEK